MTEEDIKLQYEDFKLNNKLTYETLGKLLFDAKVVRIDNDYVESYNYAGKHPTVDNYSMLVKTNDVERIQVVYKSFKGEYYVCTEPLHDLFIDKIIIENRIAKAEHIHNGVKEKLVQYIENQ